MTEKYPRDCPVVFPVSCKFIRPTAEDKPSPFQQPKTNLLPSVVICSSPSQTSSGSHVFISTLPILLSNIVSSSSFSVPYAPSCPSSPFCPSCFSCFILQNGSVLLFHMPVLFSHDALLRDVYIHFYRTLIKLLYFYCIWRHFAASQKPASSPFLQFFFLPQDSAGFRQLGIYLV